MTRVIAHDLVSIDGALERVIPQGDVLLPSSVWVSGDRLVWRQEFRTPRYYRPGPGLLTDFANLADADDAAIASFAKRRGTLQICQHGLPRTHNPPPPANSFWPKESGQLWCFSQSLPNEEGAGKWEPITGWRTYSTAARAILTAASALHAGRQPAMEVWEQMFDASAHAEMRERGQSIPWWSVNAGGKSRGIDRTALSLKVSEWLVLGNVRPVMTWSSQASKMTLSAGSDGSTTLFGAIALQLLFAVSGENGFAICSSCQSPYSLDGKRRPAANRRSYCDDCRDRGVPLRDAQRDSRARDREERLSMRRRPE